jgi:hypothetical protein
MVLKNRKNCSEALLLDNAGGILCQYVSMIMVGFLAAPSAQIQVFAPSAGAFEVGLDIPQRQQLSGRVIDPDVPEGALPYIAHHHLGHEVAGVHISALINVGHLHSRGAAAGIGQQLSHALGPGIVL